MWQLENDSIYVKVHSFHLLEAFTYGNTTTKGQSDKDKRKRIRQAAQRNFPVSIPQGQWWAFRIYVKKSGNRLFDIENVPKLIVDAFSKSQIEKDRSKYSGLRLFDDDTIEDVRIIEVAGERTRDENRMDIEIFRRK
jgi:hypothetical protein